MYCIIERNTFDKTILSRTAVSRSHSSVTSSVDKLLLTLQTCNPHQNGLSSGTHTAPQAHRQPPERRPSQRAADLVPGRAGLSPWPLHYPLAATEPQLVGSGPQRARGPGRAPPGAPAHSCPPPAKASPHATAATTRDRVPGGSVAQTVLSRPPVRVAAAQDIGRKRRGD